MRITQSCNASMHMSRCHVPLIDICDTTSQIKLDLGACNDCFISPVALLLQKGGCAEYETICEPEPVHSCCGVIDNRPMLTGARRVVEKPRPSVIYPLHELSADGLAVFALDDKLKTLGYGRVNAYVLIQNADGSHRQTGISFDIDYLEYQMGLGGIITEKFKPIHEDC